MKKIIVLPFLLLLLSACAPEKNNSVSESSSSSESTGVSLPDINYSSDQEVFEDTDSSEHSSTITNIGTPVDFSGGYEGKYRLTVTNISTDLGDGNMYVPENGMYLKVDFILDNTSSEEIYFNVHDFSVYDGNDTKGEVSSREYFSENVAPGKNANGTVYLDTSETGPYEVHFANIIWEFKPN